MKKTALAANIGFLLMLGGYFLTLEEISTNSLELLLMVFALISPVASILVLLQRGAAGLATRLGLGFAHAAWLTTLCVYLIVHKPLEGLDLVTDWPVVLLLTGMLITPVLSIVAIILVSVRRCSGAIVPSRSRRYQLRDEHG